MKTWTKTWKSSKQRRKQRKYRYCAPLHIKHKFMGCHLSKELRQKYKKRAIAVRKGDTVMIVRGQFKGKKGKVEQVNLKKTRINVAGVETIKKDGTKAFYPVHPSNCVITELMLEDKKRLKALTRK